MVEEIAWTPFEMSFEISEEEKDSLHEAFKRYMDMSDKKIQYTEFFADMKQIDIEHKQPLLYEILERILDLPEIQPANG